MHRFSELTNTEANCEGTKEILMKIIPYLDIKRNPGVYWRNPDEFQAEANVTEVYQTNPTRCYFSFCQ